LPPFSFGYWLTGSLSAAANGPASKHPPLVWCFFFPGNRPLLGLLAAEKRKRKKKKRAIAIADLKQKNPASNSAAGCCVAIWQVPGAR
jgi:hypothetical protein